MRPHLRPRVLLPVRVLTRALARAQICALACALAACADTPPDAPPTVMDPPRPIGGNRDAHGCLVAAGYTWCERERACVRPWELANAKGFENSASGYEAWCKVGPATP